MTIEDIRNPTVKSVIQALAKGDRKQWLAAFIDQPELFDDGSPRNFTAFTNDAIGHERFARIDRVENNGMDIYGYFHSDQWGDFETYFKFKINSSGKVERLDIGQA